mgnify:CR=1 FL=1
MDMVGYAKSYNSTLDAIGGDKHPHAKKVIEEIRAKYPNIRVKFTNQVGGGSDHEPFFDKKIPGVFWHTGVSSNPNYHKTSDHVDKIDFDGMLTISKIAFEHLFRMANDAELTNTYFKFDSIISPDFPRGVGCHSMVTSSYVEEVTDYMLNGPE